MRFQNSNFPYSKPLAVIRKLNLRKQILLITIIKTMKKLILLTLLLCANFIYSQNNETKSKVTSFVIESNNQDELKDIKWRKIKRFFKRNDKNDSIKIAIKFKNNLNENSKIKTKLNNFEVEVKGQTFELNKMIRTAKNFTKEMLKNKIE